MSSLHNNNNYDAVQALWSRQRKDSGDQNSRRPAPLGGVVMETLEEKLAKALYREKNRRNRSRRKGQFSLRTRTRMVASSSRRTRSRTPGACLDADYAWRPPLRSTCPAQFLARLDRMSLVRGYAEGTIRDDRRLADEDAVTGLCATRVVVWKTWHVGRDERHLTVRLEQVKTDGTVIPIATAHMYENYAENIRMRRKEMWKSHRGSWLIRDLPREEGPEFGDHGKTQEERYRYLD